MGIWMSVQKAVAPGLSPLGLFSLLGVACLTIMVGCVIVPGLPGIAKALGVANAAGWLVTLPSLGVVVFGPLAGRLIDRIGPYRVLCGGLVLYGLLGLMAVTLHGAPAVFADRILLGGATAAVMASGTALLTSFHAGPARLKIMAVQGMAIELGGVVFLAAGGLLTRQGWAAPFLLYCVAFLLCVMVLCFVPAHGAEAQAEESVRQAQALQPVWPAWAAALLSQLVFFTAVIVLPFRLAHFDASSGGLTESQTGYFLSFISLVAVCAAWTMPRVTRRLGPEITLATGFAAYALAHLCFACAESLPVFICGGVLAGAGFGLTIPLVNHMTVERSHVSERGRNLAYLSMAIFLGQFASSFMQYVPGGFRAVFICAASIAAMIVLATGLAHWIRQAA